MEIDGKAEIALDPATLWARLTDAERLRAAIPGCTEMTGDTRTGFAATVARRIGPLTLTLRGAIAVEDAIWPESCTLVGEGRGGLAGHARGTARLRFVPTAAGTELTYLVHAEIGGRLASMGARLVAGHARRMVEDFLGRIAAAP